jgi:hypothetical protein
MALMGSISLCSGHDSLQGLWQGPCDLWIGVNTIAINGFL